MAAAALLRQLIRAKLKRQSGRTQTPLSALFPSQQAVANDNALFKALLCGRGAGKTSLIISEMAHGMMAEPHSANLYISQTGDVAKRMFYEPFRRLSDLHGWGFQFDDSELTITHPNGAWCLCAGIESKRELEKRRGIPWRRVRIDECGVHRPSYLEYFVHEVIEPRLMDANGDIWLAGTPTKQAFGYFYRVTTGKEPGWSVHRWTAATNPYVNFHRFVHEPVTGLLARRGWTQDNPIFRREYLAEWVVDSNLLVYRFSRDRNIVLALPRLRAGDEWVRIMGLDFGVGDATACSILAYPRHFGRDVYVEHTWSERGLAPSDAAVRIYETFEDYQPEILVGDVNGLGKAYQREWNKRFPGIEMKAANKADKRGTLEFVSDALHTAVKSGDETERRGLLSLECNEDLHAEWASLQWDEERDDIAEGQDDDLSDSAMYAYKESPAYDNPVEPPPTPEDHSRTTRRRRPDPDGDGKYRDIDWRGRRAA